MKFSTADLSSTTEAPSIIEDITFLTNCTTGNATGTFPWADMIRCVNLHYNEVVADIIAANSNWTWDDTNQSDLPIGTTTLVAAQQAYSLPIDSVNSKPDLLKIIRVEVMNSSGDYVKLEQFDESEVGVALSEYYSTNGMPVYYREIADQIELYPAPATGSVTMAAGLKIYYQRNAIEFTKSNTTTTPGFAKPFHRVLSFGASLDYFLKYPDPQRQPSIERKYNEMRQAIRTFYGNRNKQSKKRISVAVEYDR